jgi:hypothetical protein
MGWTSEKNTSPNRPGFSDFRREENLVSTKFVLVMLVLTAMVALASGTAMADQINLNMGFSDHTFSTGTHEVRFLDGTIFSQMISGDVTVVGNPVVPPLPSTGTGPYTENTVISIGLNWPGGRVEGSWIPGSDDGNVQC